MKRFVIFCLAFQTAVIFAHDGIKRQSDGGVSKITAGGGVSVSPGSGTGNVTVSATVISTAGFATNTALNETRVATGAIAGRLNNGAITVNDEGAVQGNATTLDFVGANVTATAVGSTITVTVTGGAASASGQSPFVITIGTLGATGVDIASNTIDGYVAALVRLKANGLTNSTTAGGLIYVKEGIFSISNATVPAGVTIVAVGSTVWVNAAANNVSSVFIFGTVDGLKFDLSNRAFSAEQVCMRNNGILRNSKIYGAGFQGGGAGNLHACALGATDAFNVLIEHNILENFRPVDGITRFGDDSAFMIRKSSFIVFRDNQVIISANGVNGGCLASVIQSSNVVMQRNNFPYPGFAENGISLLDHVIDFQFLNNTIYIFRPATNGIILFGDNTSPNIEVSSACVISDNVFISSGGLGTSNIFYGRSNTGTKRSYGIVIKNNFVNVGTNSSITFYKGDGQSSAILLNNVMYGVNTFTSGTGRIIQAGNYKDDIAQ